MVRRPLALLSIAVTIALFVSAHGKTRNDPVVEEIHSIVKTLSDISGLSETHPVPYGRMSKRQLRRYLGRRIKRMLKPEEIRADELALKMFGLVPADFDLRRSTIDLLTEQAAAFYDYDTKKLFLLESAPSEDEKTTLAHELSHALADQHFNLGKFMDESPANDDENLAHTAVVEGQASWLMIAYDLKEAGQPPAPTPEMLRSVTKSTKDSMADYPVLKNSPLYIQQSLLFPYTAGTEFFDSVYRKLGKRAFSEVFADPPIDSAQVMHPNRYLAHERPSNPAVPTLENAKGAEEVTEGSLGEFDHEMLIRQFLGPELAASIAPHLRGGNFKVMQTGRNHHPVLMFASQWDSAEDASRFFSAYKKILAAKWKECKASVDTQDDFEGTGDNGRFNVHLAGDMVSGIEGLEMQQQERQVSARLRAR